MRSALIGSALLALFTAIAAADDKPPDISRETEASLHRYVGQPVVVRGRFSLHGTFGPFVDTGRTRIYVKPDDGPDLDSESEGKEMIVVGTLRYHSAKASFFYLGGDCAFLKPGAI